MENKSKAEEKIEFKDSGKFFNWITEIAKTGKIQITSLGTYDGIYWVRYATLKTSGMFREEDMNKAFDAGRKYVIDRDYINALDFKLWISSYKPSLEKKSTNN